MAVVDIYAYLQARADGALGRGHPVKLDPMARSAVVIQLNSTNSGVSSALVSRDLSGRISPVRLPLSIALVVFIASGQDAFADQHWWTLVRGTDFKIYDKCVTADRISRPQVAYENAMRAGWPAKLEDKGSEVDVNIDFKPRSLFLRWFRTEADCNAAAQSNHGANASPDDSLHVHP
jgi:hypothetical protein